MRCSMTHSGDHHLSLVNNAEDGGLVHLFKDHKKAGLRLL